VVSGVPETVTGGIFGGQQQIAVLALSWYPNNWLRFMLQFQSLDVNKLNSAGKVQIGQRFETIAGRVQAAWRALRWAYDASASFTTMPVSASVAWRRPSRSILRNV